MSVCKDKNTAYRHTSFVIIINKNTVKVFICCKFRVLYFSKKCLYRLNHELRKLCVCTAVTQYELYFAIFVQQLLTCIVHLLDKHNKTVQNARYIHQDNTNYFVIYRTSVRVSIFISSSQKMV